MWTGTWGRGPEALARLEAHNAAVRRVRCRIEKVFGTCKRSYGLRRMRWLGLAKAGLQVRLAAMAYNLRRTVTLLRRGGLMRDESARITPSAPTEAEFGAQHGAQGAPRSSHHRAIRPVCRIRAHVSSQGPKGSD